VCRHRAAVLADQNSPAPVATLARCAPRSALGVISSNAVYAYLRVVADDSLGDHENAFFGPTVSRR
jgi:hypothetical protein